jgi:hypothetical protein
MHLPVVCKTGMMRDAHRSIVHPVPLVPSNLLCLSELLEGAGLLL